jgi:hypothetical protein
MRPTKAPDIDHAARRGGGVPRATVRAAVGSRTPHEDPRMDDLA